MKKNIKHPVGVFLVIMLSILASSACILAVPAAHNRHGLTMLCSGIFWAGMAAGYGVLFYVNAVRRRSTDTASGHRAGIISFFRNTPARIADISGLVCIILLIISFSAEPMEGYLQFVLFFLIVFLFHMHCILNGENYRFLQLIIRRKAK